MTTHEHETRGGTSASNAPYDAICAGRHIAQRGLPDLPSGDAQFGQGVHDVLATGDESEADARQLNIAESCKEIESKLVAQVFGPDASKCKVFTEERFWCRVEDKFLHSAKPDRVYRYGPKALIVEFKALAGDRPESPENLQIRHQVVLAARGLMCTEVFAALVQPLITHTPTVTRYDEKAIAQAEQDMRALVVTSNDPASKRTASALACKFCKARSMCPEYAIWNQQLLPAPVNVFGLPVSQWTSEQAAMFLEGASQAQKWIDECRQAMKERLQTNPDAIPGWTLEPGDVRKPVNNPQELFTRFGALASASGIGTQVATEMFLKSVGVTKKKFEAQVRAVTKLKGKGLNAQMEKLLEGITDNKQSEPSLARRKDK